MTGGRKLDWALSSRFSDPDKLDFLNTTSQIPNCTYFCSIFALRSMLQNIKFNKDGICVYVTFVFLKPRRALACIKVINMVEQTI